MSYRPRDTFSLGWGDTGSSASAAPSHATRANQSAASYSSSNNYNNNNNNTSASLASPPPSARRPDTFSLGWHQSPSSTPVSSPASSRRGTARLDPAAQPVAGMRVESSARGTARVEEKARPDTAKDALFGGDRVLSPNPNHRPVGGSSNMAGILSTPEHVPLAKQATPTPRGRAPPPAELIHNKISSLDLTTDAPIVPVLDFPSSDANDSSAPSHLPQKVLLPHGNTSRFGPSGMSQTQKSSVVLGTLEVKNDVVHTGKAMIENRHHNSSSLSFGTMELGGVVERPHTAATAFKNKSQLDFSDDGIAPRPGMEQHHLRPSTSRAHHDRTEHDHSDIFGLKPEPLSTAAAQKNAVSSLRHSSAPEVHEPTDPLQSAHIQTSRKNESQLEFCVETPPALLPSPADSHTSHRQQLHNMRNRSTLFDPASPIAKMQPAPPPPQKPDLPPTPKSHLKIVRHSTAGSVKNLLSWE